MTKNKINHEWSILCSDATVDSTSNNLSLFNTTEQLKIDVTLLENMTWDEKVGDAFPLKMVIVSRFRKIVKESEVVSGRVKIDFTSPDNQILSSLEQEFELKDGMDNMRMLFGVNALPFIKSGLYYFVINVKETGEESYRKVYSLPLKTILNIKPHDSNKKES